MRKFIALSAALVVAPLAPALAQSRDCRSSDPDRAIAGCTADIARDQALPGMAEMLAIYYNLRGWAYQKKDRIEESKSDLDTAVRLRPGFITHFNRALFCSEQGMDACVLADYAAAIAAYDRLPARAQRPLEETYLQANFRLAEILRLLERPAEAMPLYDKIVAMRPDNLEFLFNRALAHSRLEHFDIVIAELTRVIGASPRRGPFHVISLINRGLAHMRKGDFSKAIADLDTALALDPGSPGALARRGYIFERAGQRDKAIADYRETLNIYSRMPEALEGLKRLEASP